jgi:cyanophycinase
MRRALPLLSIIFSLCFAATTRAQNAPGALLPIGGGYSDIYAGFSQAAVANAKDNQVNILVLAPTYSTNPLQITEAERQTNLKDANERRFQIEEACKRAASPQLTCKATLAPIFTRSDAENPTALSLFTDDLAAIFILGGDQTIAMQVIIGTPVETRLEELHNVGVIVGGTSAGGGMQSRAMLAGYNTNYAAENSLFFGASDVWNSPEKHGLTFGLQTAIIDQHFYQRARFGRLINAILQPGVPHLGIGVDAYTGVTAKDDVLGGVFGLYTVTVLDAETYHSADAVQYISIDENRPPLLSARNILVNLLSPGDFSYNLKTRVAQFGKLRHTPAPRVERRFEALTLPPGAGPLILAGDLSENLESSPAVARFKALAGENVLVVATGYSSERSAQGALKAYASAFNSGVTLFAGDQPIQIPPETSAIVIFGKDQSKITPAALAPIKEFWLAGKPVLADNAAAALMGSHFSAHGPTPKDAEDAELATQKSFRQGKTSLQPGLGLLEVALEPQILADNRFGRWFSLAYNHPDLLAFGLNQDTAIEVSVDGAVVLGENGIFVLDLRAAQLAMGGSDGFVIANGLLDVFAPGERLEPQPADTGASFQAQPTPVLSLPTLAPTATATASPFPTSAPTNTSQPSATPLPTSAPERPAASQNILPALVVIAGAAALAALALRKRTQPQKRS